MAVDFPKDPVRAAVYYRCAAESGNLNGQYFYAQCLEMGVGVRKDVAEAINLFGLSARQGHTYAQNRFVALTNVNLRRK